MLVSIGFSTTLLSGDEGWTIRKVGGGGGVQVACLRIAHTMNFLLGQNYIHLLNRRLQEIAIIMNKVKNNVCPSYTMVRYF